MLENSSPLPVFAWDSIFMQCPNTRRAEQFCAYALCNISGSKLRDPKPDVRSGDWSPGGSKLLERLMTI